MTRPTLQNRVDPFGQLHAVPHRGTLMGNRGILHDSEKKIRRQWAHKGWVTCTLSFSDVRHPVFAPSNYTELFFLDEATSLTAGHRPCNTCQRERYSEFRQSWLKANMSGAGNTFVPVSRIDRVLYAERAIPGGGKRTFEASVSDLPTGTMFEYGDNAYLVWKRGILLWSFGGYMPATTIPSDARVRVLTPPSMVRMFDTGFMPRVHSSADSSIAPADN
jgi:hypothetical protein